MKTLTKTELIIIYNLTKGRREPDVRALHKKASAELTYRGAFL